jgi:formylglycine-generating enzyme required for sulfatase activity
MFNCNAMKQAVPCTHGVSSVANLFTANSDGSGIRQVCFDQDHDYHPTVLNNGQVMYNRWDYTGPSHVFQREIMVMNPDGTGQRALYGTNTYFPNSLYYAKALPNDNNKIVCVITGYHDPHKSGFLVVIDLSKGYRELEGMVARISGKGDPLKEVIDDGAIQGNWPIFTTPFPLNENYFLVSMLDSKEGEWVICLADIFDNLIELKSEKGYHLFEPIPVIKQKTPPVIPDKVNLHEDEGTVYLHNIYSGPGLDEAPKGEVKKIRVFAYNFGFVGLAGPNTIGYGGPWEAMRILGTVPIEADGSAFFKVPANTPISVQPLDKEGKALQLMRSWFSVMPGEVRSCIGCHEDPRNVPPVTASIAARTRPKTIDEWYGPARGFDFEREVQPVLNHYCVECHNGTRGSIPDFREEKYFPNYEGKDSELQDMERMHKDIKQAFNGKRKYTPAYDELIKYIRRVTIEDDVYLLTPGPFYTSTSELVQMLKKGHYGVQLNQEAWDRIYTWIDLNGPCHGTWGDIHKIPEGAAQKRRKYAVAYANQKIDPEFIPDTPPIVFPQTPRTIKARKGNIFLKDWPYTADIAAEKQKKSGEFEKTIKLADGIDLQLVKIPSGHFIMGDLNGQEDERPLAPVEITHSYWMGKFEITNEIYNLFKPEHDSKFFAKRHERDADKGAPLNAPKQPVLNISWIEAKVFCEWLSKKTKINFTLPSEAQWEYACRAGSNTPLSYGEVKDNFSSYANVGDYNFSYGRQYDSQNLAPYKKIFGFQVTGGITHLVLDGAALADKRFDDHGFVTVSVGSYKPNLWGLYDMHGNAAEWTLSSYMPYPYNDNEDERNNNVALGEKVVRGGSFYDRPERCRSAFRLSYPVWLKVFNVGFRVVSEIKP